MRGGVALKHAGLVAALVAKGLTERVEFTPAEAAGLALSGVRADHYVAAGGAIFRPDRAAAKLHLAATLHATQEKEAEFVAERARIIDEEAEQLEAELAAQSARGRANLRKRREARRVARAAARAPPTPTTASDPSVHPVRSAPLRRLHRACGVACYRQRRASITIQRSARRCL